MCFCRPLIHDIADYRVSIQTQLVLEFHKLHSLAHKYGARIEYSATVCGGLPVINVARRDLVGCRFHSISGIFNSTTNCILSAIARGQTAKDALVEAQRYLVHPLFVCVCVCCSELVI